MKKENLNDVMRKRLLNNRPLLAFDENNDYQIWKKQIKDKLYELLGMDIIAENAQEELNIDIEEVVEFDTYTRLRYTYESEKDVMVPVYICAPKELKEKMPVVICLQGHSTGFHLSIGETKFPWDSLDSSTFGLDAIKHGYVAICVEQRGMGERGFLEERNKTRFQGEQTCYQHAMDDLLLGRTILGGRALDVSKCVDTLAYFKDKFNLDLDDISLMGISGGATATYYAAAFEPRIKVAVPVCAICSYKDSIGAMYHCCCNYIPHIARYMDMGEIAALIAPRKLGVIVGELDRIFPLQGSKEVYSVIEKIYQKEGVPNNCTFVIEEGKGHYFDKFIAFKVLKELRGK